MRAYRSKDSRTRNWLFLSDMSTGDRLTSREETFAEQLIWYLAIYNPDMRQQKVPELYRKWKDETDKEK